MRVVRDPRAGFSFATSPHNGVLKSPQLPLQARGLPARHPERPACGICAVVVRPWRMVDRVAPASAPWPPLQ
jgi:hypothetical protein